MKRRPALSESVGKYRKALVKADVAAGETLGKVPGLGRILQEEIRTPVKTVGPYEIAHVERVKRLTAPLVKAQRFAVPFLAYEGLRRIMTGHEEAQPKAANMTRDEQKVMMDAASLIEKLGQERELLIGWLAQACHEKQAVKMASEMADAGYIAPEEMSKKAEELSKESDLGIVKKALDLTSKGFGLGRVEKRASVEGSEDGEEMDPMTEYLVQHVNGSR